MKNTIITSIITTLTVLVALQWPLITIFGLWIGFGIFTLFWAAYDDYKGFSRDKIFNCFALPLLGPITPFISGVEWTWPKDFKWLPKFQSPIVLSKKHE